MSQAQVQQVLSALHQEIAALEPEQHQQREKLEQLVSRLETELASEALPGGKFQQVLEHFESEHPQLTEILNRISLLLSNMGL